ncbi:uncharacterized protein M6B38_304445 [Iris pallida]|uniref:Uncharacterized protein n=1 Tax=Iris pallida TaxID=29817 RepID=A0AAX6HLC1_IRIPA|nr:uncharacterized protein M6B38_304445 [Iris pallida]
MFCQHLVATLSNPAISINRVLCLCPASDPTPSVRSLFLSSYYITNYKLLVVSDRPDTTLIPFRVRHMILHPHRKPETRPPPYNFSPELLPEAPPPCHVAGVSYNPKCRADERHTHRAVTARPSTVAPSATTRLSHINSSPKRRRWPIPPSSPPDLRTVMPLMPRHDQKPATVPIFPPRRDPPSPP